MEKKTVTKRNRLPLWDKESSIRYYEEMARDGYFVCGKNFLTEKFKVGEGEDRTYAIMIQPNLNKAEAKALEETGWRKDFWYEDCLVLSTAKEGLPLPFDDSPMVWERYLKKKETNIGGIASFCLILGITIPIGFYKMMLLGDGAIFFFVCYVLLGAWKTNDTARRLKKIRRSIVWKKESVTTWRWAEKRNWIFRGVVLGVFMVQIVIISL